MKKLLRKLWRKKKDIFVRFEGWQLSERYKYELAKERKKMRKQWEREELDKQFEEWKASGFKRELLTEDLKRRMG